MRVLTVDSDSAMAHSVKLALKSKGLTVDITDLGETALDLARGNEYELIVLELDLCDMPGMDVLRALRTQQIETPILILSERNTIEMKVEALGAGADDYLTKPFHTDELVARARAIIRRSRGHAQCVIEAGPISLHLDSHLVFINGTRMHFAALEYRLLELLCLGAGTIQEKRKIFDELYGQKASTMDCVDVLMCKVRRKIASLNGGNSYILTCARVGYLAPLS